MKRICSGLCLLLAATWMAPAQTNAPPIKGMASTVGLYVYPKNRQSGSQQLGDESQCYSNAKAQTGYDPNATTTAAGSRTARKSGDKTVAQSAARGAVISGATGGSAMAGARRGALIGSIKQKREQKQETEQADRQASAAKAADQPLDSFKRSMSACLDARNYSVK